MPGATQARLSARNGRRHRHVGVANLRALELKPEDTLRVFQRREVGVETLPASLVAHCLALLARPACLHRGAVYRGGGAVSRWGRSMALARRTWRWA